MGSAPRTTNRTHRSAVATAAFSIAALAVPAIGAFPSAAIAAHVVHLRAIVLGTTPEALDVGLPNGDDVHLDMMREPDVSIAEPATAQSLRTGLHVSVLSSHGPREERVHGIVISGNDVHFVHDGSYPWDAPRGASMTVGRIVRMGRANGRLLIVVAYRGAERRIEVPQRTPVIALRPGSRKAFINPHTVFVFATPPTDGLSFVLQSAIVGDGDLQLPL